ncbi:MAG: hypothetical protein GAK34_00849 [Delftia tsuruhatensis]|nr:MAG: hypothetical protein GAK34_00849 [Delftia tsuruhatensis]
MLPAPALGHEVDGLGGAAHEDDLVHVGRVDEAAHALARALVGVGGAGSEFMGRAVDVGVLVLVEMADALDHRARLVRGGRVVQPGQGPAVDALGQDGKVPAHGMHVEGRLHAGRAMPCPVRSLLALQRMGRRGVAGGQHHGIDKVKARLGRRHGGRNAGPFGGHADARHGGRRRCSRCSRYRERERGQRIQRIALALGHAQHLRSQARLVGGQGAHDMVGHAVAGLGMGQQRGRAVGQRGQRRGRGRQQVAARRQALRDGRTRHAGA